MGTQSGANLSRSDRNLSSAGTIGIVKTGRNLGFTVDTEDTSTLIRYHRDTEGVDKFTVSQKVTDKSTGETRPGTGRSGMTPEMLRRGDRAQQMVYKHLFGSNAKPLPEKNEFTYSKIEDDKDTKGTTEVNVTVAIDKTDDGSVTYGIHEDFGGGRGASSESMTYHEVIKSHVLDPDFIKQFEERYKSVDPTASEEPATPEVTQEKEVTEFTASHGGKVKYWRVSEDKYGTIYDDGKGVIFSHHGGRTLDEIGNGKSETEKEITEHIKSSIRNEQFGNWLKNRKSSSSGFSVQEVSSQPLESSTAISVY